VQLSALAQAPQVLGPVQGQLSMPKGCTQSRVEETQETSERCCVPMTNPETQLAELISFAKEGLAMIAEHEANDYLEMRPR
jgi:hypothetical protein